MTLVERQRFVLVTGCTPGGIGHSICLKFKERGFHAIATARNPDVLSELSAQGICSVPLDLTSNESIAKCHREVARITSGRLDILVNNAGRTHTYPATDLSIDDVRKTFEVNVFGVMAMVAAFADQLISAKGLVINIASLSAVVPYVFGGAYCASKGAVVSYSRTLRQELRPFGVRVLVAMVGPVRSNITNNWTRQTLPKDSHYRRVADVFEKRLQFSQENAEMCADEYAEALVGRAVRPEVWWFLRSWIGRPDWFWHGRLAWAVWLGSMFFGEWVIDYVCWLIFGLKKLERMIQVGESKGGKAKSKGG
ncbi:NAD(P)-binding protein [Astrocystis sublimbata]|nr:NAD(P)-binding protein [Astrocystis sublimbata]